MSTPGAGARMPAAFLGHGSPMNALEDNDCTAAWQAFGASVPRPSLRFVPSKSTVPVYTSSASTSRRFGDGFTQASPVSSYHWARV